MIVIILIIIESWTWKSDPNKGSSCESTTWPGLMTQEWSAALFLGPQLSHENHCYWNLVGLELEYFFYGNFCLTPPLASINSHQNQPWGIIMNHHSLTVLNGIPTDPRTIWEVGIAAWDVSSLEALDWSLCAILHFEWQGYLFGVQYCGHLGRYLFVRQALEYRFISPMPLDKYCERKTITHFKGQLPSFNTWLHVTIYFYIHKVSWSNVIMKFYSLHGQSLFFRISFTYIRI